MITIKHDKKNIIEVKIGGKIKAKDMLLLKSKIEKIIKKCSTIKVVVNAVDFNGWDGLAAIKEHIKFVKSIHKKVDKIALVAGKNWQKWLVRIVRLFVHPKVKIFNKGQLAKARKWINE